MSLQEIVPARPEFRPACGAGNRVHWQPDLLCILAVGGAVVFLELLGVTPVITVSVSHGIEDGGLAALFGGISPVGRG